MVPQALTGQLVPANQETDRFYWRRGRMPSAEYATRTLVLAVVLAGMVALTSKVSPGSMRWLVWLLIPTMIFFGRGFAELARLHRTRNQMQGLSQTQLNTVRPFDLPAAKTDELINSAPSVTEGTTRTLETDARTRQL